jgi:hypothetical protein
MNTLWWSLCVIINTECGGAEEEVIGAYDKRCLDIRVNKQEPRKSLK